MFIVVTFAMMTTITASADNEINARIIGGTQADSNEFPFQVYVRAGNYACGGTIIDANWVLTAAHCFDNGTDNTSIVFGTNSIENISPSNISYAANIIIHSGYNANVGHDNDIALIELDSPVSSASIDTVSRTGALGYVTGTLATITGWGDTDISSVEATSSDLMKVNVPVVSSATCMGSYGNRITDNMLCAGYSSGGYDSCQGDSGGPLFVQNSDNTETLIGVVSWGTGCAQPDYYGVYTKVANYTSWIETNTGLTLTTPTTTGEDVSADLFPNISTATSNISSASSYDIDTNITDAAAGSFTGAVDKEISINTYTIGGEIGNISVSDADDTIDLDYTTFGKIDVTVNTESGDDAAIIIRFPDEDQSDYTFARCPFGFTNFLSCNIMSESDIVRDSSGGWAMLYLKNNDGYDQHLSDIISDSRAIGDGKIETDIYVARDTVSVVKEEAGDILGGGGGGGCSAGNGAAYGLTVLIFFCVVYLMRRKMMSNIKEKQDR